MLRVTEKKDEIIVREVPNGRRFLYFTAAVLITLFFFFSLNDVRWYKSLIAAAFALLFFGLFLAVPVTTTIINRRTKTVSVRKRSLIKHAFDVYRFDELAGSIYVETEDERGLLTHRLMMPLKNGDKIPLSIAKVFLGTSATPVPTAGDPQGHLYFNTANLVNPYIFDGSKQISAESGVD